MGITPFQIWNKIYGFQQIKILIYSFLEKTGMSAKLSNVFLYGKFPESVAIDALRRALWPFIQQSSSFSLNVPTCPFTKRLTSLIYITFSPRSLQVVSCLRKAVMLKEFKTDSHHPWMRIELLQYVPSLDMP